MSSQSLKKDVELEKLATYAERLGVEYVTTGNPTALINYHFLMSLIEVKIDERLGIFRG